MLLTFGFLNIFSPRIPAHDMNFALNKCSDEKRCFLCEIQNLTLALFCPLIFSKGKKLIAWYSSGVTSIRDTSSRGNPICQPCLWRYYGNHWQRGQYCSRMRVRCAEESIAVNRSLVDAIGKCSSFRNRGYSYDMESGCGACKAAIASCWMGGRKYGFGHWARIEP